MAARAERSTRAVVPIWKRPWMVLGRGTYGADLLALGVSSFGHVGGVHYQNLSGWTPYLEAVEAGRLPFGRAFPTGESERMTREMILQLTHFVGRQQSRLVTPKAFVIRMDSGALHRAAQRG